MDLSNNDGNTNALTAEVAEGRREEERGREEVKNGRSEIVDQASNAVFQMLDVKVDEQSDLLVAQFEIGYELGMMDRMNGLNGFYFDYNFILD
jgi:hypothetical protein